MILLTSIVILVEIFSPTMPLHVYPLHGNAFVPGVLHHSGDLLRRLMALQA